MLSCTCCLDSGIKSKKIRLIGYVADDCQDLLYLTDTPRKGVHRIDRFGSEHIERLHRTVHR